MSDAPGSQSQEQSQTITLNLKNSGDPALETHIFGELYSVGKQLGRIAAALDVALVALEGNAALQTPAAVDALGAFRAMQADILRAKEARRPEDAIVEVLEKLRAEDREAFFGAVGRLRAYLDGVGPG